MARNHVSLQNGPRDFTKNRPSRLTNMSRPREKPKWDISGPPKPFLRTARITIPYVPMEKVGAHYEAESKKKKIHYDGGVFGSVRSPKKNFFTIHPEWVSENLAIHKLSLQERQMKLQMAKAKSMTFPPRRCRSAPPPRSRNIITWQNNPT